jgi:hypothetical protein
VDLVEAFLSIYSWRAEVGRRALGVLADAAAYPPPEVVRRAFRLGWSWFSLGAPAALEGLQGGLFAREKAKLQASFADALEESRVALRTMAAGLVDHLLVRLAPGPDGRRKRFEASTVTNLLEWCDGFSARNLADDAALAAEVAKIRRCLAGVSAEDLRGSSWTRRGVAADLEAVKGVLDGLLTDAPTRAFFVEEPAPAAVA